MRSVFPCGVTRLSDAAHLRLLRYRDSCAYDHLRWWFDSHSLWWSPDAYVLPRVNRKKGNLTASHLDFSLPLPGTSGARNLSSTSSGQAMTLLETPATS